MVQPSTTVASRSVTRRLRRGMFLLVTGFVGLFGLRFAYGFWSHPEQPTAAPTGVGGDFQLERKNYASSKHSKTDSSGAAPSFDQKYERVADASLGTHRYDEDEKKLWALVEKHQGLVQAEQKSGLSPTRSLRLAVGVDPSQFDQMVEGLEGVATLERIDLHKTDKTNDYRKLQASRLSLTKSMVALTALKDDNRGGLSELVQLEGQILETERQIQDFGVQLGEFDEENEFCTVKVMLTERASAAAVGPSWPQRIKVAFEWTVPRYCLLIGILAVGATLVLLLLLIADKLGAIRAALGVTKPESRFGLSQ